MPLNSHYLLFIDMVMSAHGKIIFAKTFNVAFTETDEGIIRYCRVPDVSIVIPSLIILSFNQ